MAAECARNALLKRVMDNKEDAGILWTLNIRYNSLLVSLVDLQLSKIPFMNYLCHWWQLWTGLVWSVGSWMFNCNLNANFPRMSACFTFCNFQFFFFVWGLGLVGDFPPFAALLSLHQHPTLLANAEKFKADLMKIAMTTLSSKILSQDKEHFAKLAVDAVMRLKLSRS